MSERLAGFAVAISAEAKGFTIDHGGRAHFEGNATTTCEPGSVKRASSRFQVDGKRLPTGYHLEVDVKARSRNLLWENGRIILDYNENTKRWKLTAYVAGREEPWLFCNPLAVVDLVAAGLECCSQSDEAEQQNIRGTTELLAQELRQIDIKQLDVELYDAGDCLRQEQEEVKQMHELDRPAAFPSAGTPEF